MVGFFSGCKYKVGDYNGLFEHFSAGFAGEPNMFHVYRVLLKGFPNIIVCYVRGNSWGSVIFRILTAL